MNENPDRPTLFAPCSLDLLNAVRDEVERRDMTMAGFIRQAVAKALGLPADFRVKPAENKGGRTKRKKQLARSGGRG